MKKGFSLVEVTIVIIILGLITTFAMPNYFRGMEKQKERSISSKLMQLALGSRAWQAATAAGTFGASTAIGTINSTLRTDVMLESDETISVTVAQTTFTSAISWQGAGKIMQLTETDLICCSTDNCLTRPDCP